jgi:mono/diheme cytochrome c family protein
VSTFLSKALASIAVALFAAVALVGCSDPAPEIPVGPDGEPDAVLSLGRDIWASRCSSCHGAKGQGGRGKKVADGVIFETHPDIDTMIEVIAEGKGRGMPGFGDDLTVAEIEAVSRYVREVLN